MGNARMEILFMSGFRNRSRERLLHINGILGMDFLLPTQALIDYSKLDIRFNTAGV